ncbi:hypothetical protein ACFYYS_28575 [Streptomyces sp. NPDC002120]
MSGRSEQARAVARTPSPHRTAPHTRRAPYADGDLVAGTSYVHLEDHAER